MHQQPQRLLPRRKTVPPNSGLARISSQQIFSCRTRQGDGAGVVASKRETQFTVYVITNTINGMMYVGASRNWRSRCQDHLAGHSLIPLLVAAVRQFGRDNFRAEPFACALTEDDLYTLEQIVIAQLGTRQPHGYNKTLGGPGLSGLQHTEATKQQMSESAKGRQWSDDQRQKYRARYPVKEPKPPVLPRRVVTPDGEFPGVAEAAKFYGLCRRWANRCATEGFRGWRYIDADPSDKEVRPSRQKVRATD